MALPTLLPIKVPPECVSKGGFCTHTRDESSPVPSMNLVRPTTKPSFCEIRGNVSQDWIHEEIVRIDIHGGSGCMFLIVHDQRRRLVL